MVTGVLVAKPWWVASSMAAPWSAADGDIAEGGEGVEIVDMETSGCTRAREVEAAGGGVSGEVVPATVAAELVGGEDLVGARLCQGRGGSQGGGKCGDEEGEGETAGAGHDRKVYGCEG